LNDSDQTNESKEGESSEDESGNSPSPEGEPEGANNLNPDGARPIRTRRRNPSYVGSQWTTMARRQTQKVKAGTLNNAFIQSLDWSSAIQSLLNDYAEFKADADKFVNHLTNEIEWWNTLALAAKTNASDNPRWHEAMNAGYWEARKVEISTLTKLEAWEVVQVKSDMKVLD